MEFKIGKYMDGLEKGDSIATCIRSIDRSMLGTIELHISDD